MDDTATERCTDTQANFTSSPTTSSTVETESSKLPTVTHKEMPESQQSPGNASDECKEAVSTEKHCVKEENSVEKRSFNTSCDTDSVKINNKPLNVNKSNTSKANNADNRTNPIVKPTNGTKISPPKETAKKTNDSKTNKLSKTDSIPEVKESIKLTTKIRSKIAKLTKKAGSPEKVVTQVKKIDSLAIEPNVGITSKIVANLKTKKVQESKDTPIKIETKSKIPKQKMDTREIQVQKQLPVTNIEKNNIVEKVDKITKISKEPSKISVMVQVEEALPKVNVEKRMEKGDNAVFTKEVTEVETVCEDNTSGVQVENLSDSIEKIIEEKPETIIVEEVISVETASKENCCGDKPNTIVNREISESAECENSEIKIETKVESECKRNSPQGERIILGASDQTNNISIKEIRIDVPLVSTENVPTDKYNSKSGEFFFLIFLLQCLRFFYSQKKLTMRNSLLLF